MKSPRLIYRLILPVLAIFSLSCTLILSDSPRADVNVRFEGCRVYLNPETQQNDFWISLQRTMEGEEPEGIEEVLTGCIASRQLNGSRLVDYVTASGQVRTGETQVATIMALRNENNDFVEEITATLQDDGSIRFVSSWDRYNIPEPLPLAAVQCDCDSLRGNFGLPSEEEPQTLNANSNIVAVAPSALGLVPQEFARDIPSVSVPRRDARFFGTYCQMDPVRECRDVKIKVLGFKVGTRRKCVDVTNGRLSLDVFDGRTRDGLYGLGEFMLGDKQRPFATSGRVESPGLGSLSLSLQQDGGNSIGNRNVHLVEVPVRDQGIDHRLVIDAFDTTMVLGKQACGNEVPEVTLSSTSGSNLQWGQNHCFVGRVVEDSDASFPQDRLTMQSSRDGEFVAPNASISASGPRQITRCTTGLSPGQHTVTFTARDSGGLMAKATTEVTVSNRPPMTPIIVQPRSDDTVVATGDVIFEGKSFDYEEGMLSGSSLNWFASHEDGAFVWIGSGRRMTTDFPTPGAYQLRLVATDGVGETTERTSSVTVLPFERNTTPRVTIEVPPHLDVPGPMGGSFPPGDVIFRGTVDDTEDSNGDLRLRWDATPVIPAGPPLPPVLDSTLAVFPLTNDGNRQVYEIVFRAEDSGGLVGKKVIRVIITP